jgi:photosystem I subunit 2
LVAGAVAARRGAITRYVNAPKKVKLEQIPRPEKLLESPRFPLYAGATDGYFARATRERHAMTWTGPKEVRFEMPTGGFAYMNKGENLCYFRKKEQCIALTKNLRKLKISDIKIYRIKKDGTVIFMHPLDGIWPENVTTGRPLINWRPFASSGNPQPAELKWTKYHQKPYEADPLSIMFTKARLSAFIDQESVFPMPLVAGWMEKDSSEYADYTKKMKELVNSLPPLPKSL